MRINTLVVEQNLIGKEGLKKIDISRLGSVVALVGKNGSGKSRILNIIETLYPELVSFTQIFKNGLSLQNKSIDSKIHNIFRNSIIKNYILDTEEIEKLRVDLTISPNDHDIKNRIKYLNQTISGVINDVRQTQIINQHNNLIQNVKDDIKSFVKKRIKKIRSQDIRNLKMKMDNPVNHGIVSFERLLQKVAESDEYNELDSINNTALEYLAQLPHILVYDKDESYGDATIYESTESFKRYKILKDIVKKFLNKDLEWVKETSPERSVSATEGIITRSKGAWKLGERKFDYAELSDGEKTLFAYCLLFFLLELNPQVSISESIIIIDEPELHLHPETELKLINGIRKIVQENGQLWIATHSLSIISSLAHEEIFMVKDGAVFSPNRSIPGKTLKELMGLTEYQYRLNDFLLNISNWSFVNFMTQCFSDPEVIKSAQKNDPEVEVFFESLKKSTNASVLLDFGAGQGRVYKEIISNPELKLNYSALEPNEGSQAELKQFLPNRVYSHHNQLPEIEFDYILLCNVLHEIPVIVWEDLLNKIKNSLKPEGYIIFIEDQKLPRGEKIGRDGFLILEKESLEKVFAVKSSLCLITPSNIKYQDRILCTMIKKENIGQINKESIISGINDLYENSFIKIKELRNKPVSNDELLTFGRLSAYYSQLHINAKLALETLKELPLA